MTCRRTCSRRARSRCSRRKVNSLRGYNQPDLRADDLELNEIIGLIEKSERPVLYCGGGIISSDAAAELRQFAEAAQIPVTTTLMGCGAFPETHPLSLRWLGMHGAAFANWAVNGEFEPRKNPNDPMEKLTAGADLLLAFGVRFDDRVTGKVDKFCENGTIVHLDIDPSEINKNKPANLPVVSDIKFALARLNAMLAKRPLKKKFTAWHKQIEAWKAKAPFGYMVTEEIAGSEHMRDHLKGQEDQIILPQMAIEMLVRVDQGRGHHHHRRGPAPDVGRAILQVQIPAPVHDQRRAGRDGLRLSRRARRQGGAPGPAGGGY